MRNHSTEQEWRWPRATALTAAAQGTASRERYEAIRAVLGPDAHHGVAQWLAQSGRDTQSTEHALKARSAKGLSESATALGAPARAEAVAAAMRGRLEVGPIGIFCDYDVDGGCASAIMHEAIKVLDASQPVPIETAERDTEGFGPNRRALDALVRTGAKTVLVLDCGTESGALLDEYAERDLCPIVIDHHPPRGHRTPSRGMMLNPWCEPESPWRALCTGALAWWTALACLHQAESGRAESAAMRRRITALAGLATACDNMTLDPGSGVGRFNRALVAKGAVSMRGAGAGLMAILDQARTHPAKVQEQDLSWRIGPRINAGSRGGASGLAARCLNEAEERAAREMAAELAERNRARRTRCNEATARALGAAGTARGRVRVVWDETLNPGNAGVVASKILEKEPGGAVVVMGRAGDGQWRGSGRSEETDLGAMVEAGVAAGWLAGGGGHAMACGLSVEEEGRGAADEAMRGWGGESAREARAATRVDIALSDEDLSGEGLERLRGTLDRLEPFGNGWEGPKIGVRGAVLTAVVERARNEVEATLEVSARVGRTEFEASWLGAPAAWEGLLEGAGTTRTQWGRRRWEGERDATDLIVEITGAPGERVCRVRTARLG